jgi:hypothetical protein
MNITEINFFQIEQKILKKLFEYSKEYGSIVEISDWAFELGISKQDIISIAEEMKKKDWLDVLQLGWNNTIEVSLSNKGFKIIGESPIDYINDIKILKLEKKADQFVLTIKFYNNSEKDYYFSLPVFNELNKLVKNTQTSTVVQVSDWLREQYLELQKILERQHKKHTKKLSDFCELIKNYV